MAVVKMTWNDLVTSTGIQYLIDNTITGLGDNLDSAFETKYGTRTNIASLLASINTQYLKPTPQVGSPNLWEDLPIYLSSYKVKDSRALSTIKDKLIRYLKFFTKMITDDGITRNLVTSRNFANNNSSTTVDKNLYSETPQIQLDNFENAIKYASNVARNDSNVTGAQSGASGETVTSKSWDEQMKNLRFAFYNDLAEFIADIPNILYNYYSLDSYPVPALVKARRDYYKNLVENQIL